MAAKPAGTTPDKNEPAKKRGKGLWIAIIIVLLVSAGGAAGWYYTRPATAEDAAEAKASQPRPETIFVTLDPFTVNLADEGGERLAQVGLVLEVANKEAQAALGKLLPVVRNSVLLLLSSQHTKTLLTLDGKFALTNEIALKTGGMLGWTPEPAEAAEAAATAPATPVKDAKPPRKPETAKPAPVRRGPQNNPVVAVHFSQLLVQ